MNCSHMSDATLAEINKKGFGKSRVIEELKKRKVQFDEAATLEVLRKTLREILKAEIDKGSGVDASVLGKSSEGENLPLELFDSTTEESIVQKLN